MIGIRALNSLSKPAQISHDASTAPGAAHKPKDGGAGRGRAGVRANNVGELSAVAGASGARRGGERSYATHRDAPARRPTSEKEATSETLLLWDHFETSARGPQRNTATNVNKIKQGRSVTRHDVATLGEHLLF